MKRRLSRFANARAVLVLLFLTLHAQAGTKIQSPDLQWEGNSFRLDFEEGDLTSFKWSEKTKDPTTDPASDRSRTRRKPEYLVLLFLSTQCPCSKSHEPKIKKLAEETSKNGVVWIGIHSNRNEKDGSAYFSKFPFPVFEDPANSKQRSAFATELAALNTPHAYLFKMGDASQSTAVRDSNRPLELLFKGGVDDSHLMEKAKQNYLATALSQAIAGGRPDPDRVRVLGCGIQTALD